VVEVMVAGVLKNAAFPHVHAFCFHTILAFTDVTRLISKLNLQQPNVMIDPGFLKIAHGGLGNVFSIPLMLKGYFELFLYLFCT